MNELTSNIRRGIFDDDEDRCDDCDWLEYGIIKDLNCNRCAIYIEDIEEYCDFETEYSIHFKTKVGDVFVITWPPLRACVYATPR